VWRRFDDMTRGRVSNKCINLMRPTAPIHWGDAAHRLCTGR